MISVSNNSPDSVLIVQNMNENILTKKERKRVRDGGRACMLLLVTLSPDLLAIQDSGTVLY